MTDLEQKLRDIFDKNIELSGNVLTLFEDDCIAQIKQAFADAGYITPEQVAKSQELVNAMARHAQELAKLPVAVREIGTMTGQEWHRRFTDALGKPTYMDDIDGRHSVYKIEWISEASKRAAGIGDKDV